MKCAEAMALARGACQSGSLVLAKRYFTMAHGACYDDKRLHLSAHAGLMRVAIRRGDISGAARNLVLWGLAAVFD